jgi:hypothetical protein
MVQLELTNPIDAARRWTRPTMTRRGNARSRKAAREGRFDDPVT